MYPECLFFKLNSKGKLENYDHRGHYVDLLERLTYTMDQLGECETLTTGSPRGDTVNFSIG
jgi:hypothetical protein